MAVSVILTVVRGPLDGQEFIATERTTWLVGRSRDCVPRLPDDADHRTVSRHHCLLDVNPPQIRIRDFGSLNGTMVNGTVIGRRRAGEAPEDAAAYQYPEHDLKDGDEVRLGDTVLKVKIRGIDPHRQDRFMPAGGRRDLSPDELDGAVHGLLAGEDLFRAGDRDDHLRDDGVPHRLAGYEVVSELGRGGMGAVFLVRHRRTRQEAALKVMLPRTAADAHTVARFLREIAVTRALRHENIATLYDTGELDGMFYFTAEYCPGGSLEQLMARHGGRLPVDVAVPLFLQALDGIDHAHRHGVVHRDLSPENILLAGGPTLRAKVCDFGLAKAFDQAGLSGLTRTGSTAGKPYFIPRAQVVNFRRARPDVDTWALAACLYYALTGAYPRDFTAERDPWLVILTQDAVPIQRRLPGLPPDLAEVIDHALREAPSVGFATAAEFRDALRSCR